MIHELIVRQVEAKSEACASPEGQTDTPATASTTLSQEFENTKGLVLKIFEAAHLDIKDL